MADVISFQQGKQSVRKRLSALQKDYEELQAETQKMIAVLGGLVLQNHGHLRVSLKRLQESHQHDGLVFEQDKDKDDPAILISLGPRMGRGA